MERLEYHAIFTQLIEQMPYDDKSLCSYIGEIDENDEITYEEKIEKIKDLIYKTFYN